jgi:DNA-binding NtrC family response regulator
MGTEEMIFPEDLPDSILENNSQQSNVIQYQELLRETKRKLVQQALDQANGNAPQAARILGMHSNNFYRILRNLGMKDS